ncbi:MAG: hypothetical protein CMH66_15705 [Nioella sp.]|nr:hypothetical protein [Nioella sp.]
MIDNPEADIALDILTEQRSEIAPELSLDLVRACYFVQKNNQFNNDRSVAMAEMEKLIDVEVEAMAASTEDRR